MYQEIQSSYQDAVGMKTELEKEFTTLIDQAHNLCDDLGEKITTEVPYDPTDTNSNSELDATTQAQLDSIIKEVTSEKKPDWYESV
jgi:hypothetical protein